MTKSDIINLAQYYFEAGCLVIDTETVGLKKPRHLVDIAAVHFPTGQPVFESLVKPPRSIDPHASKVHGLYNNHVAHAPEFPKIWEEVRSHLKSGYDILSYNIGFDYNVLVENANYYNFEYADNWVCIMRMYQVYKGYKKSVTLQQACEELNIVSGSHRAITDAKAAARVLYRMAKKY